MEAAAEIIETVVRNPGRAPTRIMASTGVTYGFLDCMLKAGLVEAVKAGRRRRRLMITDRGRELIKHYRVCNQLFPEAAENAGLQ